MLAGLGAQILWITRRGDGRWWRRWLRRTAVAMGGAAIALGLVAPLVMTYIDTH